jgi:hypothetical protein
VDHTVTDQASILQFIEDNWSLGRIGDNSADAYAGTLMNMFKFNNPPAKPVILDATTGTVVNPAGGGTKAVAYPKGAFATWVEAELDGTQSTSGSGGLTYQWTQNPFGTKLAQIVGGNTATPFVMLSNGPGTYVFMLTVTDAAGNQSTDTATIILQ